MFILGSSYHEFFSETTSEWWLATEKNAMNDVQWKYLVISLVDGLEHEFYDFPYIRNNHPNWRTHIFQRGKSTANQYQ